MTVCIAAICHMTPPLTEGPFIVGASDRMLTVGDDIQYEPPRWKSWIPRDKIIVLVAGDMTAHASLFGPISRKLAGYDRVWVQDVADLFARELSDYRRDRAERYFLDPFGLTIDALVSRSSEMAPALLAELKQQMQAFDAGAEAIIAGLDETGAHLFKVTDPGVATRFDASGFVGIGIGARHAESQLMLAQYTPYWDFSRAMFHIYMAKVRGEVAPGVGRGTDMFSIGPKGSWRSTDEQIKGIDAIWQKKKTSDAQSAEAACLELYNYMKETNQKQAAGSAAPEQPPAKEPEKPNPDPA